MREGSRKNAAFLRKLSQHGLLNPIYDRMRLAECADWLEKVEDEWLDNRRAIELVAALFSAHPEAAASLLAQEDWGGDVLAALRVALTPQTERFKIRAMSAELEIAPNGRILAQPRNIDIERDYPEEENVVEADPSPEDPHDSTDHPEVPGVPPHDGPRQ